jgi:hypothetical protein
MNKTKNKIYNNKLLVYLEYFSLNTFLLLALFLFAGTISAQKDLIIRKDSTEIRAKILSTSSSNYSYAFINDKRKVSQAKISKSLVDTIYLNKYDSDLVVHKLFKNVTALENEETTKAYQFIFGIGLNIGNVLEFNSPSGPDKKTFSATSAIDLGLNYFKEGKRFQMTNELHWILALQKFGVTSADHLQRATDDLNTLHDFSVAMNKSNKWNLNLIAKLNTSVFTVYDGDFFKDYNNVGKIQGFFNPYEIILSPGIKFQPNNYFRVSISPYSMRLYGLTNQQIANTGFYTKPVNLNDYALFEYKQLGAEINFWYDRKFKKILDIQYRLGLSSDYFTKLAKNGLMNGLFITKLKLFKDVYLSHRATLKGDFTSNPFKPYYNQAILLSFAKSF